MATEDTERKQEIMKDDNQHTAEHHWQIRNKSWDYKV